MPRGGIGLGLRLGRPIGRPGTRADEAAGDVGGGIAVAALLGFVAAGRSSPASRFHSPVQIRAS